MVFNSINFLIFFPLLFALYYITPNKIKWLTLLVASCFFYLNVKPVFALLLTGVTLSTYFFALLIDKTDIDSRKKFFMRTNLILIILPLFFFKYFAGINNGIFELLESINIRWPLPEIRLILPIGISFYTFMAIGYTVDVYNEDIKAEKNIGHLALFVSFFPLILAGPIERAKNMLPQFKSLKKPDYETIVQGLKFMLWGYFMKLGVADRLSIYVDIIFNNISHHNGITLLVASCLSPIQIYADFGGYSLIAIGTAKILGITVMQNFNRPFFSTSMSELWRRWHISLISWLTDYVYTPLSFAFRKYKVWGMVIAIMFTFLLSGIWHGAAITFVVWGLVQGVFLSIEALTNKKKAKFEKKYNLSYKWWYILLGITITFVLFSGSQVFGRSGSINEALLVFEKIFTDHGPLYKGDASILFYSFLGLLILILSEFIGEYFPKIKLLNNNNKYIRFFAILFITIYIVSFGVFDGSQFIYFKF